MKKIGIWITTIVTLALIHALTGCGRSQSTQASEKTKVVKIAYLPITHALPVLAAKDLSEEGKISDNVKIELVRYSSWPELTDALNSGRVDGASVLIELALKAKEQGIDLKAVALGHHNGNVIIVDPEINSVYDLKGKTFAIPHRMSSHNILFQQMLKNAGLSLSDVNVVEMPPPEMPSALAQRQIAGYCVAEPFGAKAVTLGIGKALYEANDIWENSLCCALVLNNSFIKAYPEEAKKLAIQYEQAGEYLASHSEETFNVAKKGLTLDDSVLKLSLNWISFDRLTISKETYDVLTEKMQQFGLTSNPPKYEDFVESFK